MIKTALAVCCLIGVAVTSLAAPQAVYHANLKPYSHYANNEDLSLLLNDFASAQGYVSSISPAISGVISGRFDNINGKTFMDAMRAAYGVRYYTAGNIMYFFHESEWTQTLLKPMSLSGQELINALKNGRLSSDLLPISLDKHGLLVISGPAFYVDNIAKIARSLDATHNVQPVLRVFKLKYARADDIQLNSMNETVTVPGVASILQRIVSGKSTGNSGITIVRHKAQQQGLLGKGLAVTTDQDNNSKGSGSLQQDLSNVLMGGGNKEEQGTVSVIADSRLNAVIVQDMPSRMPYYAQVIAELDKPTRLVELHASIIDVDVDASNSLGIDWSGSSQVGNWSLGGAVGNAINVNKPLGNGGGVISTIFDTGSSRFMSQINLLETNNKAKTLGRPSIITMDNVEATLEDTRTLYVPVSGYQSSDLFRVDSGTVLRVTPHIVEEQDGRYIQMVIELQSNQNSDESNVSTNIGEDGKVVVIPPAINQTKINTQAMVREGQSLLIGGYYVEYSLVNDQGIPKLKDAPGVGGLFGSNSDKYNQRKRLLLITPKILGIEELKAHQEVAQKEEFINQVNSTNYHYVINDPIQKSSGCASSSNKDAQSSPINVAPVGANGLQDDANAPVGAPNALQVAPSATQTGAPNALQVAPSATQTGAANALQVAPNALQTGANVTQAVPQAPMLRAQ